MPATNPTPQTPGRAGGIDPDPKPYPRWRLRPPGNTVTARRRASGYLTKEADRSTILQAVRSAAHGQAVLAPEVQRRLLTLAARGGRTDETDETTGTLTAREREVLELIGEGLRNPEIAAHLVISEATVKTHINNLFAKAGFHSRADAVRHALRHQRRD